MPRCSSVVFACGLAVLLGLASCGGRPVALSAEQLAAADRALQSLEVLSGARDLAGSRAAYSDLLERALVPTKDAAQALRDLELRDEIVDAFMAYVDANRVWHSKEAGARFLSPTDAGALGELIHQYRIPTPAGGQAPEAAASVSIDDAIRVIWARADSLLTVAQATRSTETSRARAARHRPN